MLDIGNLEPNIQNICKKLLSEGIDVVDVINGCNPCIELNKGYSIQVENDKYHFVLDDDIGDDWDFDYMFCTSDFNEVIDAAKNLCFLKKI